MRCMCVYVCHRSYLRYDVRKINLRRTICVNKSEGLVGWGKYVGKGSKFASYDFTPWIQRNVFIFHVCETTI